MVKRIHCAGLLTAEGNRSTVLIIDIRTDALRKSDDSSDATSEDTSML